MASPNAFSRMDTGHIDFAGWLFRFLTWDGLLPVVILLVPTIIEALLRNRRGPIELAAVALPIAAMLFRYAVGRRHIAHNNCGRRVKQFQYLALCFALFVLVVIDAFMILVHVMPKGAMIANRQEPFFLAGVFSLYLFPMAIAIYPGRTKPLPEVFAPEA
ncbi:MAG: hypothetical protein ACXW48_23875 [Candidatus Binatia bacterium]